MTVDAKAEVLVEALPYLQQFRGCTMVVKYGGNALHDADGDPLEVFASDIVLMHAVGRIAYHGFIDNIQASWVKLGVGGVRQLLQAGVNDLGGTLMDENISRAAGAAHGQLVTVAELEELAASAGRSAVQRTTLYGTPLPLGRAG